MPFEPLSWLIGFALSRTAIKGIEGLTSPSLEKEIDNTINKWCKKLPKDIKFPYISLFDSTIIKQDEVPKEINNLVHLIKEGKIPRRQDWFNVFFYLWTKKKRALGSKANNFFKLTAKDAKEHLETLSRELEEVCKLNERLFKSTTIDDLSEMKAILKGVAKDMKILKGGVANSFQFSIKTANKFSQLKESLFICETKTNKYLGASINNSGLIVCGGQKEDDITQVFSLAGKQLHKIVSKKWNQLNFILIDSDTNGLVPEFIFGIPKFNENLFTFDSDGNVIPVKHFMSDGMPWLSFALKLIWHANGMVFAEIQDGFDMSKIMSSPVFNDKMEFVGIGIITAEFESPQDEGSSRFLGIISSQLYNSLIVNKYGG